MEPIVSVNWFQLFPSNRAYFAQGIFQPFYSNTMIYVAFVVLAAMVFGKIEGRRMNRA
ncbi:MAG: hypothetical protein IPN95_10195 [Bacteroidetes bacterium]|nr:hypothetical protein [Bacteroidota bacterium]